VQVRLVEAGLLKGKTVAIDATTLEANASQSCRAAPLMLTMIE
jgi:transposase